jgi:alpha-L-fucosidase 2
MKITRREVLASVPLLIGTAKLWASADFTEEHSPSTLLWWPQPAEKWTEALPVGNGRLGGMVFGGPFEERIELNEDTLWSGEPRDLQNYEAIRYLAQIKELLLAGKNAEAEELTNANWLGPWNESYMPLGSLTISATPGGAPVEHYRRSLDLRTGMVTVEFQQGATKYKRELFTSAPDQVMAIRLTSSESGGVNFAAKLDTKLHAKAFVSNNSIALRGRCPAHVEPSYKETPLPVVWEDQPEGKGMRFEVRAHVTVKGGRTLASSDHLQVSGADEAVIVLTAATSFNGCTESPSAHGRNPEIICNEVLARIGTKAFADMVRTHCADHKLLFDRVQLQLGPTRSDDRSVIQKLNDYQQDSDPTLAALYFQFGRYLLMACSRPGSQAANLQGMWNDKVRPPWSSNYTLNCNVEINYWPAEVANLSECHQPLLDFIEHLKVDGQRTARNIYGCGGWVAHHNADLWCTTSPVGGSSQWAVWKTGGAWLCHHIWEHYMFSKDHEFLQKAYPTLREASRFFVEHMAPNQEGWLGTYPASSFENTFRKQDGTEGHCCMGPVMDGEIIRDLFTNTIQAAETLEVDPEFRAQMKERIEKLPPLRVSPRTGMLQEWPEDWDAANPHNGQVAPMWAVYPGTQISPGSTPELAQAFRKLIDFRAPWKYSQGSWVGSWTANAFARMLDGEAAFSIVDGHLKHQLNPNLMAHFNQEHAEFQIDGNLGITAAIAEMLLQSQNGELSLLPALPKQWSEGSLRGFRARGGLTVSLSWKKGQATVAELTSLKEARARVRSPKGQHIIQASENDRKLQIAVDENGLATVSVLPRKVYRLAFA